MEINILRTIENFGFVEKLNGLVNVTVTAVGFDERGNGRGGEGEVVIVSHLVDDGPHGLVVVGIGENGDDFFEFDRGGDVKRVMVVGPGPIEEAEGFSGGRGACTKDAKDELWCESDAKLVEGAFQVEVATNNVCNVLDCCEVLIF